MTTPQKGAEIILEPTPVAEPKGYWDLVREQFFKNKFASYSFYTICCLLLIASWAPIIANGKPFIWQLNGKTSYPLLQHFVAPDDDLNIDVFFNYLMVASLTVPLTLLLEWITRSSVARTGRELPRPVAPGAAAARRARKRYFALIGFLLPVLVFVDLPTNWITHGQKTSWEFHPLRKWRNDEMDYPGIARDLHKANTPGFFAVFPPIPQDPITPTTPVLGAPSNDHLLGTDQLGRDVLARLLHGARISLSVGFVSVGISLVLGVFLGAIAGYYRGWVDVAISRLIEIVICFPTFFLILTIIAFIEKRSIFHIMIVIGATSWPGVARLVRGEFLKLVDQDFVLSARALGSSNSRLMFKHMLPNAMGPVLVTAAFAIASSILTESGLSFLGFGVPPPTPTWGEMITQGKDHLNEAWWLLFFPGLSIFLTVTIYNLAGDGLRDAMDPKMRK